MVYSWKYLYPEEMYNKKLMKLLAKIAAVVIKKNEIVKYNLFPI